MPKNTTVSYIFIRHAATKAGPSDKLRPISDIGITQAKKCSLVLKSQTPFDLAITSSALRTKETLKIILEQLGQTPKAVESGSGTGKSRCLTPEFPKIVEVASIYEPTSARDQAAVDNMLKTLGEVSLEKYIESDIHNSWSRYEQSAIIDLFKVFEEYKPKKILVIGHGNIINSLGLSLAPTAIELKKRYFGNCEGFEILDDKLIRMINLDA